MNIQEWGEPMASCPFHPLEDIVGICASCLRERLHHLKAKIELERGFYSSAQFPESTADHNSNISPHHRGICALENRQIVARTKSLWLTKPTGQNKERRIRFIALRSFFHRLHVFGKNKDIKQHPCLSHEDSFITIKFESNERNSSWLSAMLPSAKSCRSNSSRNSVSERSRPSWDGMSRHHGTLGDVENHQYSVCEYQDWRGCSEDYEGESASISESSASHRWRSRIKEMFHVKWRIRKSMNAKKKDCHQIGGLKDPNYQFPTSKIWSLSTLNYDERERHCTHIQPTTKRNKSWMRTLTTAKWGLH